MKNSDESICKTLYWSDVSASVRKVNPAFASIIDQINPDESYVVYSVKYSFGDSIVREGKFLLPENFNENKEIMENLYAESDMPFGIIINRSIECFIKMREKIIPFFMRYPGMITSLWSNLDQGESFQHAFPWNITAGARSSFLLPKITDNSNHAGLEKSLGLTLPLPISPEDHWNNFIKIHKNSESKQDWATEIIFFSRKWVQSILYEGKWEKLRCFMLQEAWKDSQFWRNEIALDFVLNKFVQELDKNGFKVKPKLLAILKRVIVISLGVFPGFAPAINDNEVPLNVLQNAYLKLYKLDKYIPTIMVPSMLNLKDFRDPIYYSLQWDMLLEPFSEDRSVSNTMTILEEVDRLLFLMKKYIRDNYNNVLVNKTPLKELNSIKFKCFHCVKSIYRSKDIVELDDRFAFMSYKQNGLTPCHAGQFMRGCIKIEKV